MTLRARGRGILARVVRWALFLAACALAAIAILRLIYPLPPLDGRQASEAIAPSPATALGQTLLPLAAAHPGLSGIYALPGGVDAFAARISLLHGAEASIDAQYYIWQDDLTGLRLLTELQAAARRGVRVRLLLDDNGTSGLDQELAALDALPAAEVRLFNPFTLRDPKPLAYLFDFFRLNRRMHNKSLTVDGIATIVGGRNIGDVYFETGGGSLYFDFDLLAVGQAASDTSADFDRYWNSSSAYPVGLLVTPEPGAAGLLEARDAANRNSAQAIGYRTAVQSSRFFADLKGGALPLEWVRARLFSDDPAKALGQDEPASGMMPRLMAEVGTPAASLDIVSAYFVPGVQGTEKLGAFARSGIRVRTLTNALEATDVPAVHAGYIGYRGDLVDAGVEVYELRGEGSNRKSVDDLGVLSLSTASLHAKSMGVDGRRLFVGSFNFDPRSKRLNTEMGLLIDSPALAAALSGWMDREVPLMSYRVRRGKAGGLVWERRDAGGSVTLLDAEPNATLPLRAVIRLISLLPVEWLL